MVAHHVYRDGRLHDKIPAAYLPSNVSTWSDAFQIRVTNAHQGAQFYDAPTELPQSIELDEDGAGTAVAGGLDFVEGLRKQSATKNEREPELEEHADRSCLEDSVAVEPSQGSRTVFSEEYARSQGKSGSKDALHNGKKPITSPNSPESSPTVPSQNRTPDPIDVTKGKIKSFLKNNIPLGVSLIITVPTIIGVAVGLGTKSLTSGATVGGSFLAILAAIFAYLRVRWKEDRVGDIEERQREGSSYDP
ncbi:MAG: hypothetical protein M1839_003978 [Geoglossum umbratile]|nr:MAG: hypothetical protein M1839_003978 [Geoglossum umbratile]